MFLNSSPLRISELMNDGKSSKENGVWILRIILDRITKLLWPLWVNSEYLRIWCISEFTQITNIIIRWTILLISMITLIIWRIENLHFYLKSVNFWSKTHYFWSKKEGIFNGKWGFSYENGGFSSTLFLTDNDYRNFYHCNPLKKGKKSPKKKGEKQWISLPFEADNIDNGKESFFLHFESILRLQIIF